MKTPLLSLLLLVVPGLLAAEVTPPPVPAPAPASVPVSAPAPAAVQVSVPAETPTSTGLPAMNFVSSIASDELFALIQASPTFAKLDKELVGSPITLRITHTLQPTTAGKTTGLLSAIWAGGTLGLLPVVTNNSFVVTYEVRVQGKDVATFSYERSFTRSVNIWAKDDATYGLGKEGLEWLKSTAAQFTTAASGDAGIAALRSEYERYFGVKP